MLLKPCSLGPGDSRQASLQVAEVLGLPHALGCGEGGHPKGEPALSKAAWVPVRRGGCTGFGAQASFH